MCETDTEREGKILYDLIEKTSTIHYRIIHSSLSTSKSFNSCVVSAASYSSFIYVDLCILFPIQICNRNWWNKSECTHLSFSKYETQHTHIYTHHPPCCPLHNALFLSVPFTLPSSFICSIKYKEYITREYAHISNARLESFVESLVILCECVCVCHCLLS